MQILICLFSDLKFLYENYENLISVNKLWRHIIKRYYIELLAKNCLYKNHKKLIKYENAHRKIIAYKNKTYACSEPLNLYNQKSPIFCCKLINFNIDFFIPTLVKTELINCNIKNLTNDFTNLELTNSKIINFEGSGRIFLKNSEIQNFNNKRDTTILNLNDSHIYNFEGKKINILRSNNLTLSNSSHFIYLNNIKGINNIKIQDYNNFTVIANTEFNTICLNSVSIFLFKNCKINKIIGINSFIKFNECDINLVELSNCKILIANSEITNFIKTNTVIL